VSVLEQAVLDRCYAVAPIENTTEGLVTEIIKGFWLNQPDPPFIQIIREIHLPVKHHLLVHADITDMRQITQVISHPQAIGQCRDSLAEIGISLTKPVNSTALAAKLVSSDPSYKSTGALASRFAGELYGLKFLKENMQDYSGNMTRFHILGNKGVEPTGNDRTAILFKVKDEPRSLLNALWSIGTEDGVNMSSIHSIPQGATGGYVFYCEFGCHIADEKGKKILKRMRTVTEWIKVLGAYPKGGDHA
jgi:chorismate mutase/prephenate dehydratase